MNYELIASAQGLMGEIVSVLRKLPLASPLWLQIVPLVTGTWSSYDKYLGKLQKRLAAASVRYGGESKCQTSFVQN
jgi:hypothetical protein